MRFIPAMCLVLVVGAPIFAANGRSVTVCWRYGVSNWSSIVPEGSLPDAGGNEMMPAGALVRFDIGSNNVTKVDTLIKMTTAFCQYPAWSLDGSRVAFFRWPYRIENGVLKQISGDSPSLCVIDMNGKNMKNLVTLPGNPAVDQALDWPADGWIYYAKVRPAGDRLGRAGYEIWKANPYAVTPSSTNQLVNSATSTSSYIRRFSLNQAATRVAVQCYQIPGVAGTSCGNHAATFPDFGTDLGYTGSCNIKISASGTYIGAFSGGAHDIVVMGKYGGSKFSDFPNQQTFAVAHTSIYSATKWAGFDMGSDAGVEQLCWASNSDKWYCENIGWHYGGMRRGMNQLIVNWIDNQAIIPTRNPDAPSTNNIDPAPGAIGYQGFCGDFWVKPSSSSNDYAYEDTTGAWHQMSKPSGWTLGDTSLTPTLVLYRGEKAEPAKLAATVIAAGVVSVSLPDRGNYIVSISDISGKILAVRNSQGKAEIRIGGLSQGACVVRAQSARATLSARIAFAR